MKKSSNFVLIADPRVLSIPIQENQPLVDLVNQKEIVYGPSPEVENNTAYTQMRKSVYEKLLQAQARLPSGMKICLCEALRTLEVQEFIFEARKKLVEKDHPHFSKEQVYAETLKMVSPVRTLEGKVNIPPHSTGAAVDVCILNASGKPVEMGIHPLDWLSDVEDTLSVTDSKVISEEAKANRKLLSQVMEEVGFVNYPFEYWHWSYGDRYWAYIKGEPHALYGTVISST